VKKSNPKEDKETNSGHHDDFDLHHESSPHRDERHRDERHRDERQRDERHRDERHRDEHESRSSVIDRFANKLFVGGVNQHISERVLFYFLFLLQLSNLSSHFFLF